MKDFDDLQELSAAARTLLDETRSLHDPSPGDRDRVKRAMLGAIAGGAGLAATTAATGTAAAAGTTIATAGGISLGLKIAAAVLLAGAVGGTTLLVANPSDEPATRAATHVAAARATPTGSTGAMVVEVAPEPEPRRESEPAPVVAPQVETAATTSRRPRAAPREPTPSVEPTAPPSSLAEELALLRRAQRAIAAGDPSMAVRHLDELAERFPDGVMVEEREAARVVALCESGRREDARATAQRFLRERPASPLRARVSGACP